MTKELARRWFAAQPGIKLVNAYGLTETSDDTNHEVMDRAPEGQTVPLGRPVNNVRVYVVDEHLAPVPLGAPGEIAFSGVCVGRGYVNDPERTRLAYLPDPHRDGERLYRSGDYGRWLPDGKLEFLGRRDAQVKVSGFRIEIGEIQEALMRVPGVRAGCRRRRRARRSEQAARGLLLQQRAARRPRAARPAGRVAPRLHDPDRVSPHGRPAADRQRQGRPQSADGARRRARGRRRGPGAPEHAGRAAARRGLGHGARHAGGPDRPAGRLLRPGRHVARGAEAGGRAGPRGDAPRGHPAPGPRRSRGADRRWRRAALRAASGGGAAGLDTASRGKPPIVRVDRPADVSGWAAENRDDLREIVAEHGSVLVRGLGLRDAGEVGAVFQRLAGSLMPETEAFASRRAYSDGVYSSSTWPATQPMCMHHELSYALEFPGLLLFACLNAPGEGGATAVAGSRGGARRSARRPRRTVRARRVAAHPQLQRRDRRVDPRGVRHRRP